MRSPSDCDPKTKDCFFLSFKQDHNVILIEMSGPSEGYIAFALSHDQWMVSNFLYLAVEAFMTVP